MMFGVNLFSCFFCLWSLLLRGAFFPSIAFASRHSLFMWHSIILSITSATGQIFIFHIIGTYGPVVFTIIMTLRQVASIFLSSLLFQHHMSSQAYVGVFIVAASLFGQYSLFTFTCWWDQQLRASRLYASTCCTSVQRQSPPSPSRSRLYTEVFVTHIVPFASHSRHGSRSPPGQIYMKSKLPKGERK